MKHEEAWNKLHDHFDGLLTDAETEKIDSHVASCSICSGELAALNALLAKAEALPEEIAPPRDLWQGIAGTIAETPRSAPRPAAKVRRLMIPRRASAGAWSTVLAAAAILIVVFVARRGHEKLPLDMFEDQGVPIGMSVNLDPTAGMTLSALDAECRPRTARLPAAARTIGSASDTRTLDHIEENLRLIDLAIGEARSAWELDPHNQQLARRVVAAYRARAKLQTQAKRIGNLT